MMFRSAGAGGCTARVVRGKGGGVRRRGGSSVRTEERRVRAAGAGVGGEMGAARGWAAGAGAGTAGAGGCGVGRTACGNVI